MTFPCKQKLAVNLSTDDGEYYSAELKQEEEEKKKYFPAMAKTEQINTGEIFCQEESENIQMMECRMMTHY